MVGCKDYHYRFHYPGWLFRGGGGDGGVLGTGGHVAPNPSSLAKTSDSFHYYKVTAQQGGRDLISQTTLGYIILWVSYRSSWVGLTKTSAAHSSKKKNKTKPTTRSLQPCGILKHGPNRRLDSAGVRFQVFKISEPAAGICSQFRGQTRM